MRLWDDMTQIDNITEKDVAGFWLTEPATATDVAITGNAAINWHYHEAEDLAVAVSQETWTRQVWRPDRRFRDLLPPTDATVYDIATNGHHDHQRHLLRALAAPRQRLAQLAAESP
jgi:hypothetical protein